MNRKAFRMETQERNRNFREFTKRTLDSSFRLTDCSKGIIPRGEIIGDHYDFVADLVRDLRMNKIATSYILPHNGFCEEHEAISPISYGIGQATYRFYGKFKVQDIILFPITLESLRILHDRVTSRSLVFNDLILQICPKTGRIFLEENIEEEERARETYFENLSYGTNC